jgi:DNA polymerase III epsilon subunit family exonuclease
MNDTQPRLTDVSFVALDTETTGLFPMMHQLVEIGAVRFWLDGREVVTFQTLIYPQLPIPPDVQQVHGINNTMVRGKPTIEHVLPQFIEFLGLPDTILLAHNAPFDLGFLAMALTRLCISCPPYYLFDTLGMAR